METIIIIILVVIVLLIGGLFGWLISRIKFKRKLKKIDKQLENPGEIIKINKLKKEQDEADFERRKDQNDRKRKLFRGAGDRQLNPIIRGESTIKNSTEQFNNQGRIERPDNLQDSEFNQTGESESRDEGNESDNEQDWEEFDTDR